MRPRDVSQYLTECYTKRAPKPILIGPPGCGKTSVVYNLADNILKVKRWVFQATLYDPVELKGLPVFDHERNEARFIKFSDMPSEGEGILVIDDFPHAPTQTQNAFMRLILEGVAGAWNLGGLFPITTGNASEHRAGAKDLQTAMANRFVFIDFDSNYEDWRGWAVTHNISPQIISFLGTGYGQVYLNKFDPTQQKNPTQRSWEAASHIISMRLPDSIKREALEGAVGDEAANKFLGWLRVYEDLPNLDEIIKGKNILGKDLDQMYAVVSGLIQIASTSEKKSLIFRRLLDYSLYFTDEYAELGAFLGKDLFKLDPELFKGMMDKWQDKYEKYLTQY